MSINAGATSDQVATERTLQDIAAADRVGTNERASFPDNGDSSPQLDPHDSPPPRAIDPEHTETRRTLPPPRSPGDDKRAAMQDRMRAKRAADLQQAQEEATELAALQNEGLPQQDIEAIRQAEEPPQPTRRKLVVRGREMEVTDEELVAAAQKTLAGDDYLGEGRQLLEETKALKRQLEEERALLARQHPGDAPTNTQTTELDAPPQNVDPQADEHLRQLVKQIQFGDPDSPDAINLIRRAIEDGAKGPALEAARVAVQEAREAAEIERSRATLEVFKREHGDLATDEDAMAVMERRLFSHFVKDLTDAGFDVSRLRSNADVATMHMKLRAAGQKVRPISDLFEASRQDYLSWRGIKEPPPPARDNPPPANNQNPQPQQPSRQAPPRVTVNVNRDARREQIPTQPPRASAPMRAPASEAPPPPDANRSRSAVVQRMQEANRARRNGGRAA